MQVLSVISSIIIILAFVHTFKQVFFPSNTYEVDVVLDNTLLDIINKASNMDSSKRENMQPILDECYSELVKLDEK